MPGEGSKTVNQPEWAPAIGQKVASHAEALSWKERCLHGPKWADTSAVPNLSGDLAAVEILQLAQTRQSHSRRARSVALLASARTATLWLLPWARLRWEYSTAQASVWVRCQATCCKAWRRGLIQA